MQDLRSSDLGVKVTGGILGLYTEVTGVVAPGCADLHVKGTSLGFVVMGNELPWAGKGSRGSQGLPSKPSCRLGVGSVTERSPRVLKALGLGLQNRKEDAGP